MNELPSAIVCKHGIHRDIYTCLKCEKTTPFKAKLTEAILLALFIIGWGTLFALIGITGGWMIEAL